MLSQALVMLSTVTKRHPERSLHRWIKFQFHWIALPAAYAAAAFAAAAAAAAAAEAGDKGTST
jgi:hypothetical protein